MGFRKSTSARCFSRYPNVSFLGAALNIPNPQPWICSRSRCFSRHAPPHQRARKTAQASEEYNLAEPESSTDNANKPPGSAQFFKCRRNMSASSSSAVSESDESTSSSEVGEDANQDSEEELDSDTTMVPSSTSSSQESSSTRTEDERTSNIPHQKCLKDMRPRVVVRPSKRSLASTEKSKRRERKKDDECSTITPKEESPPKVDSPGPCPAPAPAPLFSGPPGCSTTPYPVQSTPYVYQPPMAFPPRAPYMYYYPQPWMAQQNIAPPPQNVSSSHGAVSASDPNTSKIETKGARKSVALSKELQSIQQKIDQMVAKLSNETKLHGLRDDLRKLQSQLQRTFNNPIAQSEGEDRLHNLKGEASPEKQHLDAQSKGPAEESIHDLSNKKEESEMRKNLDSILKKHQPSTISSVPVRDKSPGPGVRHHLCSSCGVLRSRKFHDHHPFVSQERPVINFCTSCKHLKISEGQMHSSQPFCFGCGIARSKEYQRRHTTTAGASPLPNYCAKCSDEARRTASVLDASTIDIQIEPSGKYRPFKPLTLEEVGRYDSEATSSPAKPSARTERVSIPQRDQSVGNLNKKLRPRVLHLEVSRALPKVQEHVLKTHFCPERKSASAQRRAQRSSLGRHPSRKRMDEPFYQSPYVEDVQTASPDGSINNRKTETGFDHSSWNKGVSATEADPDAAARQNIRKGERSTQAGSEWPELDPEAESSDQNQRPVVDFDYTWSSSNRTVKFKPVVNIRQSHARPSSVLSSSHAEDREVDLSPGDETRPSRAGIYGNSPRASCQEMHEPPENRPQHWDLGTEPKKGSPQHHIQFSQFSTKAFAGSSCYVDEDWSDHCLRPRAGRSKASSRCSSSKRSSPLAEGFPPNISGLFSQAAVHDSYQDSLPFRTSRGAFDSSRQVNTVLSPGRRANFTENRSSVPIDHEKSLSDGSPGQFSECMSARRDAINRSEENQTTKGPQSPPNPERRGGSPQQRPTPATGPTIATYSDHSSSSENPYYTPSQFAQAQSIFNRRAQAKTDAHGAYDFFSTDFISSADGQPPEPVVEEPDSPPSSPVQPMKMLETSAQEADSRLDQKR